MIFDRNENKEVLVLLGGGVMATAIARRIGAFLLSDKAGFITGIDILIDGGVIAAMNSGRFGLTSNR